MASTSAVPKELNFITGNKNKLAEVRQLIEYTLPSYLLQCFNNTLPLSQSHDHESSNILPQVQAILAGVIELRNQNVDLVEIQGTVEEVTTDKARRAAEVVCCIVFDYFMNLN
jgi:inosine triphosphate pyrophosphatase